jgi:xylulose-5-phosphate/fructose-6-phosphate phosphoketolase
MVVRNRLDRFHLIADVADLVPRLGPKAVYVKQAMRDRLVDHERYIVAHGKDMPEVSDWRWPASA